MLRRLLSIVLLLSPVCFGQGITIRIVNANNGHGLRKQPVRLVLRYEKGESAPAGQSKELRLETDASGQAKFILPSPAPARLIAEVHLMSEHWHCASFAFVQTQDAIFKGVTAPIANGPFKNKSRKTWNAQPGEILFVARPFPFLERLLYPLMKE